MKKLILITTTLFLASCSQPQIKPINNHLSKWNIQKTYSSDLKDVICYVDVPCRNLYSYIPRWNIEKTYSSDLKDVICYVDVSIL